MTLIESALAGGECIDDAERMRVASTAKVLGHAVRAPSTLGTFLRSFTWGHVAQLDRVLDESIRRAWAAGAGPGEAPVTVDVDSTICETYGLAKQGARFGLHQGARLSPAVGHAGRHRRGRRGPPARRQRPHRPGGGRLFDPGVQPSAPGGATGPMVLRADSGFYNRKVTEACARRPG